MSDKARREHGEGSFRELANGTWEGKRRVNGRRVYAYGATWREASSKLRVAVAKMEKGVDPKLAKQPLEAWLMTWLATEPGTTPKGRASYDWAVRVHLIPRLGTIRLDRLTEIDVERMMREVMTAPLPPARGPLSARSATIVRNTLRVALNHAIGSRILTENAAQRAKPPAGRSRKARPLTVPECERLLALVTGTPWHALYTVALLTGLREGELLGLRWQDVDLVRGVINVTQQAQYVPGEGTRARDLKTSSSRDSVPLPRDAALRLVAHRAWQSEAREHTRTWTELGLVFPTGVGTAMNPRQLIRRWHRDRAKVGLGDRHFHDLRASCASLLHARGVPIRTIQRILRHAQLATTADIYTHIFDDALAEAADALDGVFRSPLAHPFSDGPDGGVRDATGIAPADSPE